METSDGVISIHGNRREHRLRLGTSPFTINGQFLTTGEKNSLFRPGLLCAPMIPFGCFGEIAGVAKHVSGTVSVVNVVDGQPRTLQSGEAFRHYRYFKTEADSSCDLLLENSVAMRILPKSAILLQSLGEPAAITVILLEGASTIVYTPECNPRGILVKPHDGGFVEHSAGGEGALFMCDRTVGVWKGSRCSLSVATNDRRMILNAGECFDRKESMHKLFNGNSHATLTSALESFVKYFSALDCKEKLTRSCKSICNVGFQHSVEV